MVIFVVALLIILVAFATSLLIWLDTKHYKEFEEEITYEPLDQEEKSKNNIPLP